MAFAGTAQARPRALMAPAVITFKKLRRFTESGPSICTGVPGDFRVQRNGALCFYFTTNMEVGAELVLVVETSVRTPLAGVIL